MSFYDRLSRGMRDIIQPPSSKAPTGTNKDNPAIKSLAERLGILTISDDSLATELDRRRRARNYPSSRLPAAINELDALTEARRARTKGKDLRKAYKSLEVPPDATVAQIEASYRRLLRKYHPDKHLSSPEDHSTAIALVTSLTDKYLEILSSLQRNW